MFIDSTDLSPFLVVNNYFSMQSKIKCKRSKGCFMVKLQDITLYNSVQSGERETAAVWKGGTFLCSLDES